MCLATPPAASAGATSEGGVPGLQAGKWVWAMSVRLREGRAGAAAVVSVDDDLVLDAIARFDADMAGVGSRDLAEVELDMARVERVDSSGIGALVRWHLYFRDRGVGLRLANARADVAATLDLTGLVAAPGQDDTPAPEGDLPRGDETILLVDDEAAIRRLGKEVLECLGYRVVLAEDGREGLKAYRAKRDEIDLVVLDVSMPHLSGTDVLEQIRSIEPAAKVILSSGYADARTACRGAAMHATAYVSKPYRPAGLARIVREVLDR